MMNEERKNVYSVEFIEKNIRLALTEKTSSVDGQSPDTYLLLLERLKPQFQASMTSSWIIAYSHCSSSLREEHVHLTAALSHINPTILHPGLWNEYRLLVKSLLPVHNDVMYAILDTLLSSCWNPQSSCNDDVFNNLEETIFSIFYEIRENREEQFTEMFRKMFPHRSCSTKVLVSGTNVALRLSMKVKSDRMMFLQLVLDLLLSTDVEICTEDAEVGDKTKETASKLDELLCSVFKFLMITISSSTEKLEWFSDLQSVFEKTIFTSYLSQYSQFIMFFVCSLSNDISVSFLRFLMSTLMSHSTSISKRVMSTMYMGSFLARTAFLDKNTLRLTLNSMGNFIHSYIDLYDSTVKPFNLEGNSHTVFYATTQSLMYALCFRLVNMVRSGNDDDRSCISSLRLDRIMRCNLNPLMFVLPTIRKELVETTKDLEILFCDDIIQRNHAFASQVVHTESSGSMNLATSRAIPIPSRNTQRKSTDVRNSAGLFPKSPEDEIIDFSPMTTYVWKKAEKMDRRRSHLNEYFPFDPCALRNSSQQIEPLYIHWRSAGGDMKDVSCSPMDMESLGRSLPDHDSRRIPSRQITIVDEEETDSAWQDSPFIESDLGCSVSPPFRPKRTS